MRQWDGGRGYGGGVGEMRGEEGVELRSWVGGMKSKGGVGLWLGQGGMWVSRVGQGGGGALVSGMGAGRKHVGQGGGSVWVSAADQWGGCREEACGSVVPCQSVNHSPPPLCTASLLRTPHPPGDQAIEQAARGASECPSWCTGARCQGEAQSSALAAFLCPLALLGVGDVCAVSPVLRGTGLRPARLCVFWATPQRPSPPEAE